MVIFEWIIKTFFDWLLGRAQKAKRLADEIDEGQETAKRNDERLSEARKGDDDEKIKDASTDLLNGNRN